jgi:hypothetical protein
MGAETLVHLRADSQDIRVVFGRDNVVREGERLHLGLSVEKIHFFGHDGKRIDL